MKYEENQYANVKQHARLITELATKLEMLAVVENNGQINPEKPIAEGFEPKLLRDIKTCIGDIYCNLELHNVECVYDKVFFEESEKVKQKKIVEDAFGKVVLGTPVEPENKWAIKERLPERVLKAKLKALIEEYAGNTVRHKASGDLHYVSSFTVLNVNSGAEYAVLYHPISAGMVMRSINQVCPVREFFDGRFEGAIFNESN